MSTILRARSFRYDEAERGGGGGGGVMTSKEDGLLRSNLPLGDTILRGASYFVTGQHLYEIKWTVPLASACCIGRLLCGYVATITKLSPHYVLTESTISGP